MRKRPERRIDGLTEPERADIRLWLAWMGMLLDFYPCVGREAVLFLLADARKDSAGRRLYFAEPRARRRAILRYVAAWTEERWRNAGSPESVPGYATAAEALRANGMRGIIRGLGRATDGSASRA